MFKKYRKLINHVLTLAKSKAQREASQHLNLMDNCQRQKPYLSSENAMLFCFWWPNSLSAFGGLSARGVCLTS